MDYSKQITELERFVTALYNAPESPRYPYHNLAHTQIVAGKAGEIAQHYHFDTKGLFVLQAAAWFHDTGHLTGDFEGHEAAGVAKMKAYMQQTGGDEETIHLIERCILATQFGVVPELLIEQIICDADTYHFGTSLFRMTDGLVKEELALRKKKLPPHWAAASLQLLLNHRYYTHYCQQRLQKGKEENIRWLQSIL